MKLTKRQILLFSLVGCGAGIINGLFGAGAGLVLVPLISKVGKLPAKMVHATTLATITFICVTGGVTYLFKGVINLKLICWCLIGSIFGSIFGVKLLKKFTSEIIDLIFSIILIISGVFMIIF